MREKAPFQLVRCLLWTMLLEQTPLASACATCFGASDSDLARGMNVGILVLLGVILTVLAAIGVFFAMLARRASMLKPEGQGLPAIKEGA
jgi:hypothetical protein